MRRLLMALTTTAILACAAGPGRSARGEEVALSVYRYDVRHHKTDGSVHSNGFDAEGLGAIQALSYAESYMADPTAWGFAQDSVAEVRLYEVSIAESGDTSAELLQKTDAYGNALPL